MAQGHKFHVAIDESMAPTYFVVTVAEPECRTLHWQFFDRRHAESKATAERQRLEAQFCVAA
ncbi:hypothetical protein [Rhizobium sp.]